MLGRYSFQLPDLPARADDMELIAAELASNAIRHTSSGQDGGEFTLTVRAEPGVGSTGGLGCRDRRVERPT